MLQGVDLNPDPGREYLQYFDQVNPATIYLICLPLILINWMLSAQGLKLSRFCCRERCLKIGDHVYQNETYVEEKVRDDGAKFFDRLRVRDLEAWSNEEAEMIDFQMHRLTKHAIEALN